MSVNAQRPSYGPTTPLPQIVAALHRDGATGNLSVRSEDIERSFSFFDGELRGARSSREEEKFVSWLVHRGLLDDQEKELVLLKSLDHSYRSVGHVLVEMGILDQTTLLDELQGLAIAIITQAAVEPVTAVTFFDAEGSELPWDILPDLATSQLILTIARDFPDQEAKQAALDPPSNLVFASGKLDELLQEYNLTPTEAFLLSRLDGARPIQTIMTTAGLPEPAVVGALYSLLTAGLIGTRSPEKAGGATRSDRAERPLVDASSLTVAEENERKRIALLARFVHSMDHYAALGLRPSATREDIDNAWAHYRDRYDPKRAELPHLRDKAQEINAIYDRARAAYELLTSSEGTDDDDWPTDGILDLPARQGSSTDGLVTSSEYTGAAWIKKADELIVQGDSARAIGCLEAAVEVEPDPQTFLKLARLLGKDPEQTHRALEALRRAVELDPRCLEAWIELAELWRRRNRPERQRKALQRALALQPASGSVRRLYQQYFGEEQLARVLESLEPA